MSSISFWDKLRYRLWSLPRTFQEFDSQLLALGTLRRIGWNRSVNERRPQTAVGEPMPWLTYPVVYWLDGVLASEDRLLELGSGQSTRWFATRVESVVSIEHDPQWAARVSRNAPSNVEVIAAPCHGDELEAESADPYISAIYALKPESFDMILVDGMARIAATRASVRLLRPKGAVMIDNSDRPGLSPAVRHLTKEGFGRIDFVGFTPGGSNFSCTSVFSRDFNRWVARDKAPRWWGADMADFFRPGASAATYRGQEP